MICILYVIGIGLGLGLVGVLTERALPEHWPRRWIWCLVIPGSVVTPAAYSTRHTWSITAALEHDSAAPVARLARELSLGVFDPQWWAGTRALDPTLNTLWLVASGLLIAWLIVNAARVLHLFRTAGVRLRGPRSIDGVPVVVTDSFGPATVGVWHARVVVPRWVLSLPDVERRYVVRHEEEHRRAHDSLLLFLASLLLIVLPWNVALWWQLRRLQLAIEMDCDNRVVAALGDARAYGKLLFRIAEAASRGPRMQPALLGATGTLERRLRKILSPEPLRSASRILLPLAALALLALVLSLPHPVIGTSSHEQHRTGTPGTNGGAESGRSIQAAR